MQLPLLEDLGDLTDKRVLVRSDLNVPISNGEIDDDFRIRQSVATWQDLVDFGAKVTVCSHLGRPNGAPDARYSMAPVELAVKKLVPEVQVMENLRFSPGEELNDPAFVKELVADQDLYVNDAFGASHREHASIVGPPRFLPSAAGRLLADEIAQLGGVLNDAPPPFVGILGGAKVSDKIGVIDALLGKVDTMLIGGGMAYTFLKAIGHEVGNSILQEDQVDYCRRLLGGGKKIILPVDLVVGNAAGEVKVVGRDIPSGWEGFDIGPATRELFEEEIVGAQTLFWNGPVGRFEDERFREGTRAVAEAMAKTGGTTVIGGGDVVSAVNMFGLVDRLDWVSTGGGAALEFIELGDLPGLKALRQTRQST